MKYETKYHINITYICLCKLYRTSLEHAIAQAALAQSRPLSQPQLLCTSGLSYESDVVMKV